MFTMHKPRKKPRFEVDLPRASGATSSAEPLVIDGKPAFPLVAFLWPARARLSAWIILPLILMIVGLFRWAVGFWGYSGELGVGYIFD